ATQWEIEYDTAGFTLGTGTRVVVNTNPYILSVLNSNTEYDFYVRAICGANDTSMWSAPSSFTTDCLPISTLPWTETFEQNSASLPCWRVVDGNSDGDVWALYTGYAHGGTYSAGLYTDFNAGDNDDWLISPAISLSGNQRLIYWYRARSASEPNDYMVKLSTAGSDTGSFTTVLKPLTAVSNTTYQSDTLDLSAYTGTVYIAFHVPPGGLDGWYLYIDDVT